MKVFQSSYFPDDLPHFIGAVSGSLEVHNHFDLLNWLQGEIQQYLPHDILVAAWGDFAANNVHHDVLSTLAGVRSDPAQNDGLTPLISDLYAKWISIGKRPFIRNLQGADYFLANAPQKDNLHSALQKMRSAVVHGIVDERSSQDCLYIAFRTTAMTDETQHSAIAMLTPYMDAALRQITHLPYQLDTPAVPGDDAQLSTLISEQGLTSREREILRWVARGKTNPEIGSILDISEFTVKNHLQRLFKKLNVTNRAQAAGLYQASNGHV